LAYGDLKRMATLFVSGNRVFRISTSSLWEIVGWVSREKAAAGKCLAAISRISRLPKAKDGFAV
jgi:hypothetical protein